jgi:hypothetical protein
MADPRPDLNTIRTQYQVAEDTMIDYRPRAFGAIDIPFTSSVRMTKTEGALLDQMTFDRGLVGLSRMSDIKDRAFDEGDRRFPDNPRPANIPEGREREWQGNDGHRDAFRHAYWNALMTKEYGENWTRSFATAHEGGPNNPANREAMDLYNNEIGRSIGAANRNATPEQLANLVEQALNQGKLVVVDRSGNLEWSDRVVRGEHGLAPSGPLAPQINTPGVVSTDTSVSQAAPPSGQPETRLAGADPNVERMRQDPMYGQVLTAMNARGLAGDELAANLYAAASRANLAGVASIEIGKPVNDANGNPDRNLFVFDGSNDVQGPNHARVSENEARATPVQVAANNAIDAQTPQMVAPDQEPRRAPTMTA